MNTSLSPVPVQREFREERAGKKLHGFTRYSGVVNRNVVVGERLDSMVEVVEGLQDGESVVYKGVIQLKPGSKIISK